MILVSKDTQIPVSVGDTVTSFRGEKAQVTGWAEPQTSCSTGRVYVKEEWASSQAAYYPGVYNLVFVEKTT